MRLTCYHLVEIAADGNPSCAGNMEDGMARSKTGAGCAAAVCRRRSRPHCRCVGRLLPVRHGWPTILDVGNQVAPTTQQGAGRAGTPGDQAGAFVDTTSFIDDRRLVSRDPGYRAPTLVLYDQATGTQCRTTGADGAVLLSARPPDLSRFLGSSRSFSHASGKPCDFAAEAYVIAHEVGHHVQQLMGTAEQVRRAQTAVGEPGGGEPLLGRARIAGRDRHAGVWAAKAEAVSHWWLSIWAIWKRVCALHRPVRPRIRCSSRHRGASSPTVSRSALPSSVANGCSEDTEARTPRSATRLEPCADNMSAAMRMTA